MQEWKKCRTSLDMMNAAELRAFLTKNNLAFSPNDDKNANTNWQDAVQRSSAISHNHNLSFSGGSDHGSYNASINYFNKQGILKGSDLTRVIARLAVDQYALNDKVHSPTFTTTPIRRSYTACLTSAPAVPL